MKTTLHTITSLSLSSAAIPRLTYPEMAIHNHARQSTIIGKSNISVATARRRLVWLRGSGFDAIRAKSQSEYSCNGRNNRPNPAARRARSTRSSTGDPISCSLRHPAFPADRHPFAPSAILLRQLEAAPCDSITARARSTSSSATCSLTPPTAVPRCQAIPTIASSARKARMPSASR
jgi:hypothetical protein